MILKAEKICKKFVQNGSVIEVLKDFSLELAAGQIVILKGPSGSGKSTLLQILGLLDEFDSGKITLSEHEITPESHSEQQKTSIRAQNLSFIYQFHFLLPEFTALENVAMPLLISGFEKKEALEIALETLDEFGLADRKSHFPTELSGGQQQRVSLARAFISRPKLLLADEPTGSLDLANVQIVMNHLRDSAKSRKTAALIATHDEKMLQIADLVIEI